MIASPLDGVDLRTRAAATQGGYGYLERTPEGIYHPGIDLNAGVGPNADCGVALRAVRSSIVRHVGYHVTGSGRGFGHYCWLETDTGHWLSYCHAAVLYVGASETLSQRALVGQCGRTAGWDACHLHLAVRDTPPAAWDEWVAGWSYARVAREYRDPYAWLLQYAGEDTAVDEIAALRAQIAHLDNVNSILAGERDYKDELLSAANSRIGALEHDALPPLQDRIAVLERQLSDLLAQHAAAGGDDPVTAVAVTRASGRVETLSR